MAEPKFDARVGAMNRVRARGLQTLKFQDPRRLLLEYRRLGMVVAASDLPDNVKNLRTNELKPWRELRAACLFCYGMGLRLGQTVSVALSEAEDYDFVASRVEDDNQHLAPVQLKEVVPHKLSESASIQSVIDSLARYVDSADLTVAILLNQPGRRFSPSELVIPKLNLAALWILASLSPDQTRWGLWGNFLEQPTGISFAYPI